MAIKKSNKSIGRRLKNVKSYQGQQKILSDWAENWKNDQSYTLQKLRCAVNQNDHNKIMNLINQLDGMTMKRFTALNNVLSTLTNPDWHLKENGPLIDCLPVSNTESPSPILDSRPGDIDPHEIVRCYDSGMTVKEIAGWNNVAYGKIIKILVTAGVYTSETYDEIKYLREIGKSEEEIMQLMDLNKTALNNYTPYKKGIYKSVTPTKNALNIRNMREKRQLKD